MPKHDRISISSSILPLFLVILFVVVSSISPAATLSAAESNSGPRPPPGHGHGHPAFDIPNNGGGGGGLPENGSEASAWHELQETWAYRFMHNFVGYLVILVPIGLVVFLVKNGLCGVGFIQNKFIQLFVHGNDSDGFHYGQLPLTTADLADSDHSGHKAASADAARARFMRDALQLAYCFFGLQLSYLTWGLLQEKIMTQDYEIPIGFFQVHHKGISSNLISVHQSESNPAATSSATSYHIKFRNSQFLVFINRLLAFVIAISILIYRNRRHLSQYFLHSRQPPLYMYAHCALSNILSSWCQYEALKFVSFPVQVLSKGCKMIAVMLMSVCLRNKKYKRIEWFFACAISFGIWLFLLNEEQESKHHKAALDSAAAAAAAGEDSHGKLWSGVLILGLYLTFDSFTSNWQSDLFDRYKISPIQMMAAVNAYSILLTSVSLMQQSDFFPAFQVLLENSVLLRDCILLSVCSAVGQLFVYYTISTFGAVVFTLIMTLRQVFAILLSIIIYAHSLSVYGFFGIVVVFGSIFANMWYKYRARTTSGGPK